MLKLSNEIVLTLIGLFLILVWAILYFFSKDLIWMVIGAGLCYPYMKHKSKNKAESSERSERLRSVK